MWERRRMSLGIAANTVVMHAYPTDRVDGIVFSE